MVLNMASFGARGETQNEMRSVLALPDRKDLIKIGFRSLISKFLVSCPLKKSRNSHSSPILHRSHCYLQTLPGVELHLANKIFLAEGFIPTDEFRLATLESFGSLPMSLDFTNTVESSRIINTWAANHTKNRVTGLVQSGMLNQFFPSCLFFIYLSSVRGVSEKYPTCVYIFAPERSSGLCGV